MKKIDKFLDFVAGIILLIFSVIAFITVSIIAGFVLIFFGLSLVGGSTFVRNFAKSKTKNRSIDSSPVEDYNIKAKHILENVNVFDVISVLLGLVAIILLIIMLIV